MKVVKKDGSTEEFDKSKIANGCKRAGASDAVAKKVAEAVAKKAKDGMKTFQIGEMVIAELMKQDRKTADSFEEFFKSAMH